MSETKLPPVGHLACACGCFIRCPKHAAADELYEALEASQIYVEKAYECAFPDQAENDAVLALVSAALAKARGESRIDGPQGDPK